MTQREVQDTLTRYHFVGLYPITRLAKEAGFSADTIRRAMGGSMSALTQTRLEMLFKQLPPRCERPPKKGKPGHKKRYLIRYLNLRYWIDTIEAVCGKNPRFHLRRRYDLDTTEKAGFVCTKLDYILKTYLLKVFGEELKKKKVFLGDCYAAEKWIEKISKVLPGFKKDLVSRLRHRKGLVKQ